MRYLLLLVLSTCVLGIGYYAMDLHQPQKTPIDESALQSRMANWLNTSKGPEFLEGDYSFSDWDFESLVAYSSSVPTGLRALNIDMSDLTLVDQQRNVQYRIDTTGYAYNLVVLYNCGTRYITFERFNDMNPNSSYEANRKDFEPTPWDNDGKLLFDSLYGPRLNLGWACLVLKHPSEDYLLVNPQLTKGGHVHDFLASRIGIRFPEMPHYVLLIDPDGYLVAMNETATSATSLISELNGYLGRPLYSQPNQYVFAYSLGFQSMIKHPDVVFHEQTMPKMTNLLSDFQRDVTKARAEATKRMQEALESMPTQ